jgi:hypothetical protein
VGIGGKKEKSEKNKKSESYNSFVADGGNAGGKNDCYKKGEKNMKRIIVLLVSIGIITALAPAVNAAVLWVVPDNPDRFDGSSETVIDDANMGTSFSGNVLVLNHASSQSSNVAQDVYLKFFVNDDSNIKDITIGTAKGIRLDLPTIDPNTDSTTDVGPFLFTAVGPDPPVPDGYGVQYLIGDIPWHGNTDAVGNPQDDLNSFNPDAADVYVSVPFTINFEQPPEVGFTLYIYAENELTGKERVKTAYSHDGGYTHVPEFSTIAIPVAAILGLLFFFNHRKRRKAK